MAIIVSFNDTTDSITIRNKINIERLKLSKSILDMDFRVEKLIQL